jgi:hypothetical protein
MPWEVPEAIAQGAAAAAVLHDGPALRCAAEEVLENLPDGNVVLIATSVESAALAASCAVMAPSRTISWQFVNPLWRYPQHAATLVAVAPLDPGEGWKAALANRFPGIRFVFPQTAMPGDRDELRQITESLLLPLAPQQLPELRLGLPVSAGAPDP